MTLQEAAESFRLGRETGKVEDRAKIWNSLAAYQTASLLPHKSKEQFFRVKDTMEQVWNADTDIRIRELAGRAENKTAFYAGRCYHDYKKIELNVTIKALEMVFLYESLAAVIPEGGIKFPGGLSLGAGGTAALESILAIPGSFLQGGAAALAFAAAMGEAGTSMSLKASWDSLQKNFDRMMESAGEGGSDFKNQDLLDSHYNKHANEFGNISKEEYLKGANNLINSTSDDILTKTSVLSVLYIAKLLLLYGTKFRIE